MKVTKYQDHTVIDLDYIVAECVICGADSDRTGIPVYEDLVLPNDWAGEWGGAPSCERCMMAQWELASPLTYAEFRKLLVEHDQEETK